MWRYKYRALARDVRTTRPFLSIGDHWGYIDDSGLQAYHDYNHGGPDAVIDFDVRYVDHVQIKVSQLAHVEPTPNAQKGEPQ